MQASPPATPHTPTPRLMRAVSLCFLAATLIALAFTSRWPLVHDAPLMHYVVFLMDHGRAPYRDIVEMNMPGSYMLEWLAIHILGGGATGWWLWDTLSGVLAILAARSIAGPARRYAGTAAGCLAYLHHLSAGPMNWGQRDWIVAVLVLLATACLFHQIRHQQPRWIAGFTFFAAIATLIKPPVLLIALCFVLASCWMSRRAARPAAPLLLWSVAGTILPALACLAFLLRWGVLPDFLTVLRGLVPYYAGLQQVGFAYLLTRAIPYVFLPLAAGAAYLYLTGPSRRTWEQNFLLGGVLAGALLFISQRKGWTYHLGLELSFLSLFVMLEIDRALLLPDRRRLVALATLFVATLLTLPTDLGIIVVRSRYPMDNIHHLEADLDRLGGPALSNNVQCLDMTLGHCIDVLYRLQLVQTTGYIYDFYLFPQNANAVTRPLQARFLHEMDSHPPKVIVLSAQIWPGEQTGYFELGNWPAFNDWLALHYQLESQYPGVKDGGYRLYVLRQGPAAVPRDPAANLLHPAAF